MRTVTTHYHDHNGPALELPLKMSEIMSYRDVLVKETDDQIILGYLVDDTDCDNPLEEDDFMGMIYDCRRHSRTLREYEKARALGDFEGEKPDPFAVLLDVYEHGQVAYSVSGGGMQCQFDTARGGAVWVPSDELRKELRETAQVNKDLVWPRCLELAKQACEVYTDWRNGNCYGVVVVTYDKAGVQLNEDACYGYIGDDCAYIALKESFPGEDA